MISSISYKTSLAFCATRPGWWMNGGASTILNPRSFVGISLDYGCQNTGTIRIANRQRCSNFPRKGRKPKYNIPKSLRPCVVQVVMGLPCDQNCWQFWNNYQSFQKFHLVGAKLVNSYLAFGRAKLRKSSKVEFIWANSDFGGVEMVPVRPVLA